MAEKIISTELAILDTKLSMLSTPVTDYSVVASSDFGKQYAQLISYMKYLEDLKKNVDSQIKTVLESEYFASGNQSVETESCRITFVPGSYKETFDSKKFKEDHPDLYNEYIKVSSTAASLRTTVKAVSSGEADEK